MRVAIDQTCPGCGYPEMGCDALPDGPAPAMTCSRCGAAYLTSRGAGLLLALIGDAVEDADDVEVYRLEMLDELIANNAVVFLPESGDPS